MDIKNQILAYFVVLCSFLISYGVKGARSSNQEESQWLKEFKLLKKPSVKAIKTKVGHIYDCVDFYKQPAFDHPLLKNHSSHPQMRPSFVPEYMKTTTFYEKDEVVMDTMQLEDGGCPMGTIPIRRLSKEEYIHMKRFTKHYASSSRSNASPGTHFALVQTNSDPSKVNYYGVRCALSVYGPKVTPSQYSAGEMILLNGNDEIQVGWMVYSGLYKDNYTHLFQYLTAGRFQCFNMLCPGFVGVSKDTPIDVAFGEVTRRGGPYQVCFEPFVYQDPKTGYWWLVLKHPYRPDKIIGYWPREIFTGLATSATHIAVGGQAYSPPGQPLPPMGNGYYPIEDASKTAYCARFVVLDANYQMVNPEQTAKYTDDWHYGVYDREEYLNLGRTVFFGGTTMDLIE